MSIYHCPYCLAFEKFLPWHILWIKNNNVMFNKISPLTFVKVTEASLNNLKVWFFFCIIFFGEQKKGWAFLLFNLILWPVSLKNTILKVYAKRDQNKSQVPKTLDYSKHLTQVQGVWIYMYSIAIFENFYKWSIGISSVSRGALRSKTPSVSIQHLFPQLIEET